MSEDEQIFKNIDGTRKLLTDFIFLSMPIETFYTILQIYATPLHDVNIRFSQ
jgi:hypothetical protein